MASQAFSGYTLLEVLGEGPRATVYKARDPRSGSWVAFKLFHAVECQNDGRLLRLVHPHIATVSEVGRSGAQAFCVAEYLSGGALKDHIRSMQSVGDSLPADQILTYAGQIADALKYAHDEGVSHGTLKTENVMFSEDGTLKLTDFGNPCPASADLEAFGKLLYETATGRLPFPGLPVQPIEAFRTDLPAAFTQLVHRVLDREREDSYKDFRSVLVDLQGVSAAEALTHVRTVVR